MGVTAGTKQLCTHVCKYAATCSWWQKDERFESCNCLLGDVCRCLSAHGLSSAVLFALYCRNTVLGDMRYKKTIKRLNCMDLLEPLSCIYPKYFALAQRQPTYLQLQSQPCRILITFQFYLSVFYPTNIFSSLGDSALAKVCSI